MASRSVWALLAVAAVLAGCAAPTPSPPPSTPEASKLPIPTCPTPGLALTAYNAAEAMYAGDEMPGGTWSARMEGQSEGEATAVTLSSDPARKAFLMAGSFGDGTVDARFVHPYFSMEADSDGTEEDAGFYGRDHDPASDGASFFEELGSDGADDLGVDFGDDLAFADFTVACAELGGKPTLEFRHSDEESMTTLVVERDAPHRLLTLRERDDVTRDDLRVSFSYDAPNIQVDTALPRAPLQVTFELLAQQDTGDALLTRVRLTDGSQWAPVSEMDVAVVGSDDYDMGQLYNRYRLDAGTFTMDEGAFTFEDRDGNDLLSAGDVLEVTVLHGYDFQLYDNWADAYAPWSLE